MTAKTKLKSKTIKVSLATAILGALTIFASYLDLAQPFIKDVFTPEFATKALGIVGILSGVIHFVLRLLTTGPVQGGKKNEAGFTRPPLMILILVLSLMIGAVSCTAAQRAIWGKVTAGVTGLAVDAGCAYAGIKCRDEGGIWCTSMIAQGCHMGRPVLVDLVGKAVAGEQPDPKAIQAETVIAFKTDQRLISYATTMTLAPACPVKTPPSGIGFKVPTVGESRQPTTTAVGGAGVKDSPPMEIK